MKRILIILTAISLALSVYSNDVLTLTNNMMFEGKVMKIKGCDVTFKASDGNKYVIPAADILSISFEDPTDKVFTEYMNLADDDADKCMKGKLDADNYHGKAFLHVALGVLFGPFALAGAAVSNPTPQKGKDTYMMSQNKEIFKDPYYLNCYRNKARGQNVVNTAIGWGTWIFFLLLL